MNAGAPGVEKENFASIESSGTEKCLAVGNVGCSRWDTAIEAAPRERKRVVPALLNDIQFSRPAVRVVAQIHWRSRQ